VGTRKNQVFREGVFSHFLFDCYTGRRTGNPTTGSAQRGIESLPAPGASTLVFEPGASTPDGIIAGVDEGLYLTTLMGNGFNPTTGDYSRGAAGFWIEGGRIAYPVTEVNISGRMDAMLAGVEAVGNDLTAFGSSSAPTIRIREMTISGT
jgi:PmbA protein